jgi:hypothetical protein
MKTGKPNPTLGRRKGPRRFLYPAVTTGQWIHCKSEVAFNYLYLCDYELEITDFRENQVTIAHELDGGKRRYLPPLRLTECGREVLVDCAQERYAKGSSNQAKYDMARGWCQQHGYEFRVVTDEQLDQGYRLKNVKDLVAFARHEVDAMTRGKVYAALSAETEGLSIETVAHTLRPLDLQTAVNSLMHMAFYHEIEIDIDSQLLSLATLLWLPYQQVTPNSAIGW